MLLVMRAKSGKITLGLTMLKVHRYVVTSNVRSHCYNGYVVELPDKVGGRHSVKIRHDDVHEHQIVLRAIIHLVNSFQTVQL